MYAIVDIAGQQFKVEKSSKVYVHRLDGKEGSKVTLDKVLLLEDDGKVSVGAPVIKGATVSAKIISHLKDDKVLVFKKKRRKGYQKLNGHRQALTELLIEGISAKGPAKKDAPEAKATETKAKVETKKAAPAAKKAAAPKKKADTDTKADSTEKEK